jgi:hypothetical protein
MQAAAAAQIMGETTRALKIVGGTTRGTGITMQRHVTTNKWRAQQEVEPPAERRREVTEQHNNQPNKKGMMEQQEADVAAEGLARWRGQQIRGAADKSSNRYFFLRVVLLCVTSFTRFMSTCWGIVTF